MKPTAKNLLLLYSVTYALFTIHFLLHATECAAYYMHDDAIEISPAKLIIQSSILFLLPAIILMLSVALKLKNDPTLFTIHYILALVSLGLFALAINKPCESINGGHYMFISFFVAGLSYVLRLMSYITAGLLFIKTVINFIKTKMRMNSNTKEDGLQK